MRLSCGLSPETKDKIRRERILAKAKSLYEWHRHFCLLPVRLGDNDCRWLEFIEVRVHPEQDMFDVLFWLRTGYCGRHIVWQRRAIEKPSL